MPYQSLIFDFNGVLIFDTPFQEQSWQVYAQKALGKTMSEHELSVHVHGRNGKHTFEYLHGREVENQELRRMTDAKETVYRELCLVAGADFRLSPGAIELFEGLQRRRIKFTIATASGYDNLQFFIKHLDLGQWFELDTIVYDDGTLQGKPNPDIYLKAAKNIHCNPVDCVVVEDSISGIQSAQQAGIGCVVGIESKPVRSLVPQVNRTIRDLREFPVKELFDCD